MKETINLYRLMFVKASMAKKLTVADIEPVNWEKPVPQGMLLKIIELSFRQISQEGDKLNQYRCLDKVTKLVMGNRTFINVKEIDIRTRAPKERPMNSEREMFLFQSPFEAVECEIRYMEARKKQLELDHADRMRSLIGHAGDLAMMMMEPLEPVTQQNINEVLVANK